MFYTKNYQNQNKTDYGGNISAYRSIKHLIHQIDGFRLLAVNDL